MHIALYVLAAKDAGDRDLLGAVLRMLPSSTISASLIIAAAFLEGYARIAFWAAALAIDYLGETTETPLLRGFSASPLTDSNRRPLLTMIGQSLGRGSQRWTEASLGRVE
jgi:low temperature requirement protein LtrA